MLLTASPVPADAISEKSPGPLRRYEVYQPEIQRGFVIESTPNGLPYNHCSTLMWFQDRWFCAWNGNDRAVEGTPGLQILMSTSVDGRNWSAPFAPFSDPKLCETPYRLPDGKQWQPEFVIVDGELWCFFAQHARKAEAQPVASEEEKPAFGSSREEQACMFGRLKMSGGKWAIRQLDLGNNGQIQMLGKNWSLFPSQNPVQLRSGRVLVPVVLMADEAAPDAPDNAPGWWAHSKRASVIYTDDGGATWQVSAGCTPKDATWQPWEPTVWEQSDGSVAMFFRNNSHPTYVKTIPRPSEFLYQSLSRDGGQTWAEPEHSPIETISSRMYVFPLDGEGVWRPVRRGTDWSERLWLMFHNDFPGGTGWVPDRRDLALYFKRGDGFEFTAGPLISAREHRPVYAQGAVHDGALLLTYTQSFTEKRSIRYARLTPLPDPAKRYLLPRADVVRSFRPTHDGAVLRFEETQFLTSQTPPVFGTNGLSLAAWVRPDNTGTLLDTRKPKDTNGLAGGFVWGIKTTGPDRTLIMYLHVTGNPVLEAQLPVPQGEWMYAGVDLHTERGLASFHVNGKSVELPLRPDAALALNGTNARIGSTHAGGSTYLGDVRVLGAFKGPLGTAGHRALHDQFAGEFTRAKLGGGTKPAAEKLLWLDPAAPGFEKHFILPGTGFQGVRIAHEDGEKALRFTGEGSAGVDLDANNRARGDAVRLRFRFKPLAGERLTLCTAGDANQPARVQWARGTVTITAGEMTMELGRAPAGQWSELEIRTAGDFTEASVNGSSFARVKHQPKGTWIYLGQGYRVGRGSVDETLLVDVGSVESQVRAADRGKR